MMRTLVTCTAYFAAGFMLGVLRTLVLVSLLGQLAAVLAASAAQGGCYPICPKRVRSGSG